MLVILALLTLLSIGLVYTNHLVSHDPASILGFLYPGSSEEGACVQPAEEIFLFSEVA